MVASGDVELDLNLDAVLRMSGVDAVAREAAERALALAQATAPVDEGAYKAAFKVVSREAKYRRVWHVVNTDWKAAILESKLGVLARAAKAARR